jgi:hypothetical protein
MSPVQTKVKTMTGAKSGEYSRFLSFHGRNPDVLNSIANLSNDEVFTPPEFANKILDTLEKAWAESNNGENLWSNPDLKFLDPFTKSGVFLREIASRLIKGLEPEIPDLQDRVDHILTKQVFGIATTHLTSLMARRSLYCSKKANGKHSVTKKFKDESGNIWFEPLPHTWGKGTVRELTMDESGNEVERFVDGKCKYCGASKRDFDREEGLELHAYGLIHNDDPEKWIGEIFGSEMQFDVIIGNPPYQMATGSGGAQARPIYQEFVRQAKLLQPSLLCVVTPSRWFSGGMGLEAYRAEMLADGKIREIHDFPDATAVFPGAEVKGGVSFFLRDESFSGLPTVTSYVDSDNPSSISRPLLEQGTDSFIRYNEAIPILRKVLKRTKMKGLAPFSDIVSSISPFGIDSKFRGNDARSAESDVEVFRNGGKGYAPRSSVNKNTQLLDSWKIFISEAYGAGEKYPHAILGRPILGGPGSACSWTYLLIGPFADENTARHAATYLSTRFFRFLVLLRKPTQHASKNVYQFVPLVDLDREWTDAELYAEFNISSSEIQFIESMVRNMEFE